MTPRCQFVIPFVVVLIIAVLFNIPWFNPAQATNQDLKNAGGAKAVNDLFAIWSETGVAAARHNLALDWFFIAAYVTMWIAAGRYFWPGLVWTKVAVVIGLAGAVADVIENICLWMLLHGHVTDTIAHSCKRASSVNVPLFMLTALYFMAAAIGSACRP